MNTGITAASIGEFDLADILADSVKYGNRCHLAATDLVIDHAHWLRRNDFRKHIDVQVDDDGNTWAWINWEAVAKRRLAGSSSETQVLAIACAIADSDATVNLGDTILGLDRTNTRLVLKALQQVSGHESLVMER